MLGKVLMRSVEREGSITWRFPTLNSCHSPSNGWKRKKLFSSTLGVGGTRAIGSCFYFWVPRRKEGVFHRRQKNFVPFFSQTRRFRRTDLDSLEFPTGMLDKH